VFRGSWEEIGELLEGVSAALSDMEALTGRLVFTPLGRAVEVGWLTRPDERDHNHDDSEGELESEGRIGVDGIALRLDERPGDDHVVRGLHSFDLVLLDLAKPPGVGVDGEGVPAWGRGLAIGRRGDHEAVDDAEVEAVADQLVGGGVAGWAARAVRPIVKPVTQQRINRWNRMMTTFS